MNSFVDSKYLRGAGRNVEVPFHIQVNCDGQTYELVCTQVLRVLPGKRLVCMGEWNHRQVVAKFFWGTNATGHCAREEKGIRALNESGILTPRLLFKGALTPENTPVLGLQRIMQAQDIAQAWEKTLTDDQRITILERAVAVIADQHDAGLKQDDLHLENFLLTKSHIYTIDGDAVVTNRTGRPLPLKKSLKNISLFFAQFHPRFDPLFPKAFQKYTEKRSWQAGSRLTTRLNKEIQNQRKKRENNYLKKIYRECTDFVCLKTWHQFTVCDRSYYKDKIDRFLTDPDIIVDSGRLIKDGNTSTVSLVELNGRRFVIKRYNIKNFLHGLKRCIRPSRAWVSWRNAHRLSFILGIPTPKPIMLIEKRWGPFRSTAYFITEFTEGVDIHHLLRKNSENNIRQETLVDAVVGLLRLLAGARTSHGDFKATNFVLSNDKLFILDLDAMREHRFKWRFRRAFKRDLERLMQNWADLPKTAELFLEKINEPGFQGVWQK